MDPFFDVDDEVPEDMDHDRAVATVDFGLPANILELAPLQLTDVTRSLDVPNAPFAGAELVMDPAKFQVGAAFSASSTLFTAPAEESAPVKPSYLELSSTTFRSTKPLARLRSDLENAFKSCSIYAAPLEDHACGYSCSGINLLALSRFEVAIFAAPDASYLCEVRQLGGCRYAFRETATQLARALRVSFIGSPLGRTNRAIAHCPPPLLPAGEALETAGLGPPPTLARHTSEANDKATCSQLEGLLAPSAPRELKLQGVRAAGAFLASRGSKRGYTDAFWSAAAGPLARRVMEVAAEASAACCDAAPDTLDEELKCVGMAALALAASSAPADLSEAMAASAAAGVVDGNFHTRREALRAASALAARHIPAWAEAALCGAAPEALTAAAENDAASLESLLDAETCGWAWGAGYGDDAAQRFATSALVSCRV